MKKTIKHAFRKDIYLLGKDKDGIYYWLEEPSWDCNWYWGFGYVETYTNNKKPEISKDIRSHQHFSGMFLETQKTSFDAFDDFFVETPLSKEEIWKLLDYMKTFYTLREASDVFYRGDSHYTGKAYLDAVKSDSIYNEINQFILPNLFKAIKELLTVEKEA